MKKTGQSILEYSVVIAVVAAAFMGMYQYVYRSINARLKQVQDEVYESPEPGVEVPAAPTASGQGSGQGGE